MTNASAPTSPPGVAFGSTEDARPKGHHLAAAAIATLAFVTAGALEWVGRSTRTFASPPAVVLTTSGRQTLAEWRARALRGRRVLHLGRFLHYVELESARVPGGGPPAQVDYRNYLRAASASGVAREIVYVMPPRALADRTEALGLALDALPASIAAGTIPRTLAARPLRSREPVLVELAASWFDDPEAPDPTALLREAGLQVDLLVIDLAEDAPDVSERARVAAAAVGRSLGAVAARESP